MKFNLTITCDNSAFDDDYELSRILSHLKVPVLEGVAQFKEGDTLNAGGSIKDRNGSTVGKWELTEEQ